MFKQTVVFDFDGVMHKYDSAWSGPGPENIPYGPVEGIKESIEEIRKDYKVIIVSWRSATIKGLDAIKKWLDKYDIIVDDICAHKPPAIVYIDDRAITFDGRPESLLWKIKNFKPWNKKGI